MMSNVLRATSTRVERAPRASFNERIRMRTDARIARLDEGKPVELEARLDELDHEWDIERLLQANASTLVMIGMALG